MARTKQTARNSTNKSFGGVNFCHSQENLKKKRKEFREERSENKKVKKHNEIIPSPNSAVSVFDDLIIKCCSNDNGDDNFEIGNLFGKLKNKMNQHECSSKCSSSIPNVNDRALHADCIFDFDVLFNVELCRHVCDEDCSEVNREFAIEILQEFIEEQDEFNSQLEIVPYSTRRAPNLDYLPSSIVEYRKCGKLCLYKKVEHEFDILILLINEYEYLYFGQAHAHAFYGMPGLVFASSHGNSPEVSELYPKKIGDSFIPVPLKTLLESAKDFIGGLILQSDE